MVLESEIYASLHIARTDYTAFLGRKKVYTIENKSPTITKLHLLDVAVSAEKRLFSQDRSLIDSQPSDKKILASTDHTQVEKVLHLLSQPSSLESQL